MKGGTRMGKTIRVRINSTARTTSSGNIQVRTTVNNGHSTRTTTKTIRVNSPLATLISHYQGSFFHSSVFHFFIRKIRYAHKINSYYPNIG